jgi:hypothetical protein
MVTEDKSYENRKQFHAYPEDDAWDGLGPNSSSSSCGELTVVFLERSNSVSVQSALFIQAHLLLVTPHQLHAHEQQNKSVSLRHLAATLRS